MGWHLLKGKLSWKSGKVLQWTLEHTKRSKGTVGGSRGVHGVPAEPIGSGFQGLKPVTAGLKSSPSSALPNSFPTTGNAPLSLWIFLHHGTHSWFHKKPLEKYLQMSNLDFILIIVIKWERWSAYMYQTWGKKPQTNKCFMFLCSIWAKSQAPPKSLAKLPLTSLLTPGQVAGSWFYFFAFQLAYNSRI